MLGFPRRHTVSEPHYNQFYETDEFDGDFLHEKWTIQNSSVNTMVSVANSNVCIQNINTSTGVNSRMLVQPITDSTWKFISKLSFMCKGEENEYAGLFVMDSSTTKHESVYVINISNDPYTYAGKFDSPTAFSANYSYARTDTYHLYLGMELTGTNLIYAYSFDGVVWQEFESHSKTSFLSSIDRVGILMGSNNNTTTIVRSYWDFFRRLA